MPDISVYNFFDWLCFCFFEFLFQNFNRIDLIFVYLQQEDEGGCEERIEEESISDLLSMLRDFSNKVELKMVQKNHAR